MEKLHAAGYVKPMMNFEEGLRRFIHQFFETEDLYR